MFSLLMVALLLNYEPAFPPAGSGLLGLLLAFDLVNADPLPDAFEALAAMYLVFFSLKLAVLLDVVDFGI
jgi:hypothetical protein